MALHLPQSPADPLRTLETSFRRIRNAAWPDAADHESLDHPSHIRHEHQMFTISLNDIAAGRGLESAEPTGWRYHLRRAASDPTGVAADIRKTENGHTFSQIHDGLISETFSTRLTRAGRLARSARSDYEVRTLNIPGVFASALWMKDIRGSNDFLVPIESQAKLLKAGRTYTPQLYFRRLGILVKRRLDVAAAPSGG